MKRTNRIALGLIACAALAGQAAFAAPGTWALDGSATWDVGNTVPWASGIVAEGADNTAFFNTVDITAARTVTLVAPLTIGNMAFGDATTANNDWSLSGSTLTLQTTTGTPTITVDNRTAIINTVLDGNQGLIKNGTGALSLRGSNIYTGTTTINAGSIKLGYGSATALSTGDVIINSAGTLNIEQGTFPLANNFSGSGKIYIGNSSGILRLDADNTGFTGTLQVQDGVFLFSTATNGGIGSGKILLGYRGTFRSSDTTSRAIASSFNFNNASGGLTFGDVQGSSTYTGDLVFTDTSTGSALSGTTKMTVTNNTSVTLNKQFSGGSVNKWGTGTLILNGATITTSGSTTANEGLLVINGNMPNSNLTVTGGNANGSGTVGGIGSVKSLTVNSGGTVAPGNSIGTFHAGNTLFNAGSIFSVELGLGQSDLLAVTGNLTIDPAAILNLLGTADGVTNYIIATYSGTLTGTFADPTLPANYTIDYGSGSDSQITLIAVPEPASLTLLAGAMGLIFLRGASRGRRS